MNSNKEKEIVQLREEIRELNLKEGEEIVVDITKKTNPLKELFGFGKDNPITREEFLETRKSLESKRW